MKGLAVLGLVLFALSWFLPVHEFVSATDEIESALEPAHGRPQPRLTYGGPPGWRAFRIAWSGLSEGTTWTKIGEDPRPAVLSLTALTNLLMLVAAAVIVSGSSARGAQVVGSILLGCVVLNASWIYLLPDTQGALQIGYYLWVGSFAVVGFGLVMSRE